MIEDPACRTLIRLYLMQARACGMTTPDGGLARAEEGADDAARRARPAAAESADETTYILSLVTTACQVSGCNCADLLTAGYALRQWAQRRPLGEQHAWPRATRCPHVTLIDGLAGAEFAGARMARDWYGLAVALRRVALRGKSRAPVINDYVIDWIEENIHYLT
jgi:hypothetical protein